MEIKIKKLTPDAIVPKRAHATDAGMDLYCSSVEYNKVQCTYTYHSGIAFQIPDGYVGLVFPRSSVYKTDLRLSNCVGVIDSGYRGEVTAVFDQMYGNCPIYDKGDRFAQIIIMPYPEVSFVEADELDDSDRGTGGYGSTGK